MDRVWGACAAVVLAAASTVALTMLTDDTRVPVVGADGFDYAEAERTLVEVGTALAAQPELDVDALVERYPLLVGIEGREPAGVIFAVVAMVAGGVGALASKQAGNRYGRFLVLFGVVAAAGGTARAGADFAVHRSSEGHGFLAQFAFALADTVWIPLGVVLGPLLLLTVPNGHLLSRRWRWVGIGAVGAAAMLLVMLAYPLRYDGRALAPYQGVDAVAVDVVFAAGIWLWMAALLAGAASAVVRFARSGGTERQQLKWVVWALAMSVALLALSEISQALGGDQAVWGPVAAAGFLVILPAAFLASVLRRGLLDIDIVIDKTIVYGLLSSLVALVYVTTIGVAASVVGARSVIAALLAMGAAAVVVEPLRQRVVAAVDRWVWRRSATPADALAEALAAVERHESADEGLDAILGSTALAVNAQAVGLWIRRGSRSELMRCVPADAGAISPERLDYVHGDRSGVFGVQLPPGDRLRRKEQRLVGDMAAMAFGLLENARLRDQLDAALSELTERRDELDRAEHRLQTIVDDTRRDVERDLHDGAQARAVALATSIGLARARPGTSLDLASNLRSARQCVADFANGLHPEALRRVGLAGAIAEQARILLPSAVVETDSVDVDDDVAAVAYLVASEAMVNAAKHASGSTYRVSCALRGGRLEVRVADEGPGFEPSAIRFGSGLGNIRARVEGLGGALRVWSSEGVGTSVAADLPTCS